MVEKIEKAIGYSFYALFFFVPLVLHPKTSELFEFNKMVLTYALTVIIVALWLTRTVLVKKLVYRRTILDIPLLIFLATQLLSTITSVDFRTSLLGYYSRYHGGFASSLSYALLYWAYVSNMDKQKTKRVIYVLLSSAILVSIYGVLEHFGIDKEIWIQDVQTRVFSTLGQPNWLAAWLVALIPITWALALKSNLKTKNLKHIENLKSRILNLSLVWFFLSALFFLTLIYTRSRSGFIGFVAAWIVFWPTVVILKFKLKHVDKDFLLKSIILNSSFILLVLTSSSPWTPSVGKYLELRKSATETQNLPSQEKVKDEPTAPQAPQLEIDPFSSTDIRKIVWTGAIDTWKNYPILGTGVETFAISYYNFRPVEHNLVSEWDFLYNKAHNEYLNFAATTGSIGILSYFILIGFSAYLFIKTCKINVTKVANDLRKTRKKEFRESSHAVRDVREINGNTFVIIGLLSGYVSILATNFFGFSVVPVGLQFFLYPAFAIALEWKSGRVEERESKTIQPAQKIGIAVILTFTLILLYSISKYWYADLQYSIGKAHNDVGNYNRAREYLTHATRLSKSEAVFWEELSDASTNIALSIGQSDQVDQKLLTDVARSAINESTKAVELSPKNVNVLRKRASMFIKLSVFEPKFLVEAQKVLKEAIDLAPTEAKLYYNYALTFMRLGQNEQAIVILEKTIEMKPNYKNAHLAYGLVLADIGEKERAIEEFEYILKYIAPDDALTTQQLEEIRGQ